MAKDRIQVGVMGCANIARRSVIPAILSIPEFELVAIASRSKVKAEECAQQFECEAIQGYDALLAREEIDAIYMPLPTGLHEEWILKSLDAGNHVLAEKSLAMNLDSAQRMIDLARSQRLALMENFMFRFHSQHQLVFDMIAADEIGELRMFRSSFGFPPFPADNFRNKLELGGGALLDAAGYTVKASQLFLGMDLTVEGASLSRHPEYGIDEFGGAFLRNKDKVASEVAFGFDNFYQCNYEVWGSKGKITATRAFTPRPDFEPTIIIERQDFHDVIKAKPDDHFRKLLIEFLRTIREQDFERHWQEGLNQARLLQEIRDNG